jgi:PAS domain S-box-containing protein
LPQTRSELAVPLIVGEQLLGVLDVQAAELNRFTDEDVSIQTTLAAQIAVALQNARSFERSEQALQELNALTRRLTREGWEEYLATAPGGNHTYVYDVEQLAIQADAQVSLEQLALTQSLTVQDEIIGHLAVAEPQALAGEAAEIMGAVAERLSTHLENLRLTEQTETALAETRALYEVGQALTNTDNVEHGLKQTLQILIKNRAVDPTTNLALNTLEVDESGEPEWSELVTFLKADGSASPLPPGTRFYLPDIPLTQIWRQKPGLLMFGDVRTDERLDQATAQLYLSAGTLSTVLLNMQVAGRWVGQLSFSWPTPQQFNERDERLFQALMGQIATVLDNRQLFAQTQAALHEAEAQAYRLTVLNQIGTGLSRVKEAAETFQVIAENTAKLVGIDRVSVALITPEGDKFKILAVEGAREAIPTGALLPLTGTLVGRAVREQRVITVADTQTAEYLDCQKLAEQGLLSTMSAPLVASGQVLGSLNVASRQPGAYDGRDENLLQQIASQLASTLENRHLVEQIQHRATELEETTNFLDSIINKIPLGVFVKKVEDLSFAEWNQANEKLIGLKREDVLGKNDYHFFPKEEADFFAVKDREVLAGGKIVEIPEERIKTAHKGTRLLHTRKIPIPGRGGQPKYLLGISEDITERKQAEQALRENEARLSEALTIAQLANWEFDVATQMFTFNDQFYTLFRTTAKQEGGYLMSAMQYAQKFVHPDDTYMVGNEIQKALDTTDPNYSTQLEHRIIRADGSEGYILVKFRIVKNAQGQTIKTYGANQDITERKQAEEELRKLSRTVEQSPSIVVITNLEGQIDYVNPKFTELTGYTFAEVKGKNPRILKSGHTPDQEYRRLWETISAGGEWRGELHNKKKNGEFYWAAASMSPITNAEGVITHFLSVQEDITRRKEIETEREQLLVEVEAAYRQYVRREWSQFLGEQYRGHWHIEHQENELSQEPVADISELQHEVLKKGQTKTLANTNGNKDKAQATLISPITLRGEVIGTLSLQDLAPERQWTAEEIALVESVSEQLALTVENLRLFDDTQKRAGREQITREITDKMRAAPDMDTIIQTGLRELAKALGASRTYIKLNPDMEQD